MGLKGPRPEFRSKHLAPDLELDKYLQSLEVHTLCYVVKPKKPSTYKVGKNPNPWGNDYTEIERDPTKEVDLYDYIKKFSKDQFLYVLEFYSKRHNSCGIHFETIIKYIIKEKNRLLDTQLFSTEVFVMVWLNKKTRELYDNIPLTNEITIDVLVKILYPLLKNKKKYLNKKVYEEYPELIKLLGDKLIK